MSKINLAEPVRPISVSHLKKTFPHLWEDGILPMLERAKLGITTMADQIGITKAVAPDGKMKIVSLFLAVHADGRVEALEVLSDPTMEGHKLAVKAIKQLKEIFRKEWERCNTNKEGNPDHEG